MCGCVNAMVGLYSRIRMMRTTATIVQLSVLSGTRHAPMRRGNTQLVVRLQLWLQLWLLLWGCMSLAVNRREATVVMTVMTVMTVMMMMMMMMMFPCYLRYGSRRLLKRETDCKDPPPLFSIACLKVKAGKARTRGDPSFSSAAGRVRGLVCVHPNMSLCHCVICVCRTTDS